MNFFVSRHAYASTQSMTIKLLQVMKLSAMLLLLTALHVSAKTSSQAISYSGKNVSLATVFKEIRKQTGFVVIYKKSQLANIPAVTINVKNMPLPGFLDKLLEDKHLNYSIDSKTVFIAGKTASMQRNANEWLAGSLSPLLPPAVIRMLVLDSLGKPLAGVPIALKNGKVLGVTDTEGRLTLHVNEGDVLLLSSIGMESRSITVLSLIHI